MNRENIVTLQTASQKTDRQEIERWLSCLTLPVELRMPGTKKGTISGYYTDRKLLCDAVQHFSESGLADTIYTTLNPVHPDLTARAHNRCETFVRLTTTDANITRRLWLPIDCDAKKAAGIMATAEEREAAIQTTHEVVDYLTTQGFPPPLIGDSGNGGHILYRIDMENTPQATELLRKFLEALHGRWPQVDRSIHNAARIWKVYGSMVRKGDEVPELNRFHRCSRILKMPMVLQLVTDTQIRRVIQDEQTPPERAAPIINPFEQLQGKFDLQEFFTRHSIEVRREVDESDRTKYVLEQCPFNPEHANGEVAVFKNEDGKLGFHCFHASCADKHWREFREHFEPDRIGQSITTQRTAHEAPELIDHTDLGNALLFQGLHGENLRWVKEWKKWIRWTGIYWEPVETETIVAKYVHPMVRQIMPGMGKKISDDDKRKKWFAWVAISNSASRIDAITDIAQARLMVRVKELNPNPHLFATQSAVIDLRTCTPIEPSKDQWVTIISPVKYDPQADCPTFQKFITETLVNQDGTSNPELVEYMRRAFGYCLTPDVGEQVFFICHGVGKNGKSTLMDAISHVLGEYAVAGSSTLYFEDRDRHNANNEDEARLYGKRLCVTAETKHSSYFSEPKIKRLTGGDRIVASYKYQSQFEFQPTHKLFLCCNHKPHFTSDDPAVIRRIKLVPFHHVVSEDQQDRQLTRKLRAEASGILNWMLEGLRQWNEGKTLGDEFTPPIMRAAKDAYVAENDTLGEFLEDFMVKDVNATVAKADVYARYRGWCSDVGKMTMSERSLTERLTGRGWEEGRIGRAGTRGWKGWKLKPVVL